VITAAGLQKTWSRNWVQYYASLSESCTKPLVCRLHLRGWFEQPTNQLTRCDFHVPVCLSIHNAAFPLWVWMRLVVFGVATSRCVNSRMNVSISAHSACLRNNLRRKVVCVVLGASRAASLLIFLATVADCGTRDWGFWFISEILQIILKLSIPCIILDQGTQFYLTKHMHNVNYISII